MRTHVALFLTIVFAAHHSNADVVVYTNASQWQTAVGPFTAIDFTGFPNNTLISTQYASLGVVFTDGADFIQYNNSFPNDGVGLRGGIPHTITIEFVESVNSIAMDFPGLLWVELYHNDTLIYESNYLGQSGSGNFAGLFSDVSFDKVRLFNQIGGEASIDDLYFGPPIPVAGGVGLFGVSILCGWRRRRRL